MKNWTYHSYCKYPKDSTFNGQSVLNVGCSDSFYPSPNVINLDIESKEGVNCVHDLTQLPLPFSDNTFDFILANHVLEHIPKWTETFKDLIRILKVGGILEVWVPADGSSLQLGDIGHINVINNFSFPPILLQNKVCILGTGVHVLYNSPLNKWIPVRVLEFMAEHLRNVAMETRFCFKKIKE
jgi:SAM-dependent methyltransferase